MRVHLAFLPLVLAASSVLAAGYADVAPGTREPAATGSVYRAQGDGRVSIADIVMMLRASVGLETIVPGGSDGASVPGDVAPGKLLPGDPPIWQPLGDGEVGIGDVIVAMRAALELHVFPGMPQRNVQRLESFDACADLEAWIEAQAHASFDNYGGWGGWWWSTRWGAPGPLAGDADGGLGPAAPQAGSYSQTNTQEGGVDEADTIETDGRSLFVISGQGVEILRAWPVEDLAPLAHVDIEGWPSGMYLVADRLVVISNPSTYDVLPYGSLAPTPIATGGGVVKLTVIDVASPAQPVVVRETYIPGWLNTSRRIGSRIHLVLSQSLVGPQMPEWTGDDATWRAAVHAAIDAATLDDWMPRLRDFTSTPGGRVERDARSVACADVLHPKDVGPAGLIEVLTFDALSDDLPQGVAVTGQGSTVYASTERLFVVSDAWSGDWWTAAGEQRSRINVFSLGEKPAYLGAGEVPGWIATPYSMDEEKLRLRVATSTWTGEGTNVFVLEPNGTGDLVQVGELRGLAPGETLQSARFLGDVGYLCTFRRVDPLFVIDLADPTAPKVAGQLDITGWSSYLHPLDDGTLIGVGRQIDPVTQQNLGFQVSLFDVANPASPALIDRESSAQGWNWSDAEWDPHAFTWMPSLSMLAVPLAWSDYDPVTGATSSGAGLRLYRVTRAQGVQVVGDLSMKSLAPDAWPWCLAPTRSAFLEDRVLGVSMAGVVGAAVGDLAHPVGSVTFALGDGCMPVPVPCEGCPGGVGGGATGP
jgi:uncharacterized secreted protein with C-terminal beta-propeller domain